MRATATPPTGRSSARPPPTPTSVDEFELAGPSNLPDPAFNAYRKDLADAALAGRVIASHYAEPLEFTVRRPATLHAAPAAESAMIEKLEPGESFAMLDSSLGWAWGYAGKDHRVGYVEAGALDSAGTQSRSAVQTS